jgi:hypothetical protein
MIAARDRDIESLKTAARWPGADRNTTVILAVRLAAARADAEGYYRYFSELADAQPGQALPLALAGFFQAPAVRPVQVPHLRRARRHRDRPGRIAAGRTPAPATRQTGPVTTSARRRRDPLQDLEEPHSGPGGAAAFSQTRRASACPGSQPTNGLARHIWMICLPLPPTAGAINTCA